MTNDLKLTERLNETGYPLQEWCADIIKKSEDFGKNYIIKEYPYTFPPTSGSQIGVSGSTDILMLHFPKDHFTWDRPWVIYSIECKKSKPNVKNWCFLKSQRESIENETYFVLAKNTQANPLDFKIQPVSNNAVTFTLLNNNIDILDTAIVGYETNNLIDAINRSQEEKIYKSLIQAVQGSRFIESKNPVIIKEFTLTKEKIETATTHKPIKVLFMPVVVTTSSLWLASLDPSKIIEGEIDEKEVKWESKDWILYDLGLPDYLQHSDYINRAVFIVNSAYFGEFINKLSPLFP